MGERPTLRPAPPRLAPFALQYESAWHMPWAMRTSRNLVIARPVVALLIVSLACLGTGTVEPLSAGGIHVLFVGNSLTYVNDLPTTVASLGALSGDTIRVATAAGPDLALIDHWNGASNARDQIAQGGWHFVVLQQGPSSVPVNRDTLVLATKLFAPLIRAAGAKPALFMVWPSADRFAYFDDVRASYQAAALSVGGVFMPAGVGWMNSWVSDSTFVLYGSDGYHPSPLGTYVAALVIYERVTGRDARSLPATLIVGSTRLSMPTAQVRLLQAAAHAANVQYP